MTWLAASAVRLDTLRAHRLLAWGAVCCGLGLLVGCGPPRLVPGVATEGTLDPGEGKEYGIELEGERWVRLVVEPVAGGQSAELSFRLLSPAGSALADVEAVRGHNAGVLAWVTSGAGRYRLEIVNPGPLAALSYRVSELEVLPARPGDEHRAAAQMSNAAANRAFDGGREQEALELLERARAEYELGGDLGGAVEMLLDMTQVQFERDADGALAYAERGLEIARREGMRDWTYKLLDWKGRLLAGRDYGAARAALEAGIEIAEGVGDRESAGWEVALRADLGRLELRHGHLESAETTFERALVRASGLGGGAERSDLLFRKHSELLVELSRMARERGDVEAVAEQLAEALRLAEEYDKPSAIAAALHDLGNFENRRGRFDAALDYYSRSAEINAAIPDRLRQAEALLSQGLVLDKLRLPERARRVFLHALALAEERGSVRTEARAHLELGRLWQEQGETHKAQEEYRRGLELVAGWDHVDRPRLNGLLLYGLGRLEIDRHRPEEAVTFLRRALASQREAGDRAGEALIRAALGTALGQSEASEEAFEQLQVALEMTRRMGNRFEVQATLHRLASLQAREDPSAALATVAEAIEIGDDIRRSLVGARSRTHFAATTRDLYGLYVELLIRSGQPAAAFAAAEEGRARALLDLLVEAQLDLRSDLEPDLQRGATSLEERLDSLQQRLSATDGDRPLAASLEAEIERVETDLARVEVDLRQRSPRYRALREPVTLDVDGARALLAERELALEYWFGESRSLLFVLGADRFEVVELPPASEIRERVDAFRRAIDEIDPAAFAPAAHWLYSRLVEPGLAAAPAGVEHLVIVPDGALHRLPFEALVSAPVAGPAPFAGLPFLVRDYAVGYVPSLSALSMLERTPRGDGPQAGRSTAVFADSVEDRELEFYCPGSAFDDGPSRDGDAVRGSRSVAFTALEGARLEASRVAARSLGPVLAYVGAAATEARVRSPQIAAAERLHFAVHGLVCESYPERSGLVLSPGPGSADDGFLQMREIYGLELTADLAVLSACESGAGREVSGEGVVNLARAFLYAGVPSVVVSLWAVADTSTADLMDDFYAGLADGDGYSEALRRAQLTMISRGGRSASPQVWAPFVLIGRSR